VELIRTRQYLKDLKRIGVTAAEQGALEAELAANPQSGALIPGLRGLRKLRFATKGKGKSGGGRAIYLTLAASSEGAIALLTAYAKNEQSDLTSAQRKTLLALIEELDNG
jgi:hypothetical protein